MNREELHYGLPRIAKRLGVSVNVARRWCKDKVIRAHREPGDTSPWFCVESELCEDIKRLPDEAGKRGR